MKKADLEKKLHKLGWCLKRHDGNYDIGTKGELSEPVPRRLEVAELLVTKILRKAQQNPSLMEE